MNLTLIGDKPQPRLAAASLLMPGPPVLRFLQDNWRLVLRGGGPFDAQPGSFNGMPEPRRERGRQDTIVDQATGRTITADRSGTQAGSLLKWPASVAIGEVVARLKRVCDRPPALRSTFLRERPVVLVLSTLALHNAH